MIAFPKSSPESWDHLSHIVLWTEYLNNGKLAVDALIHAYLPLVNRVLERISMRLPSHVALEDLSQSALIGLYKSIVDFDPERGIPFEGYAYPRIRGAVLDELRSNDHLSRGKREKVERIETIIATWVAEYGELPTDVEIAAELGLSEDEFCRLMDEAKPWCSLDAAESVDRSLHETLADPAADAVSGIHKHDLQQLLREGFRHLDTREQKILYLYYFEDLRLSEIAALFNLTEARISQIHALSVIRLRTALSSRFPNEFVA
ncbi:MAG: FliA/WhiG family RNA polymerase sigma factor [Pontiellaceae bacterium]|nr:FliA/WhiG family RNA polymerase sigma factor [Pontiellaceae bacterium]MBN2784106.1 FliA/WhiG family RNA polymerase sigma factor [Pontiellaceae bacterium]